MLFSRVWGTVAYAALAAQAHVARNRRATEVSGLVVSLAAPSSDNAAKIEATITNSGASDLSLLKLGTLLDERPVKKLTAVDEKGVEVPFMGIELSLYHEGLKAEHYQALLAGESITTVIDASAVYDFEPGTYTIFAEGSFPVVSTNADDKLASPAVFYRSNSISISISEPSTAEVKKAWSKRTILEAEGCTAEQREATFNGIRNCESLANAAAADAADANSSRFVEYFKSNETEARNHVSGRLLAVAKECSTTDSGETRVLCHDNIGYCEIDGPLIAYTTWVNGYVTMCPLFYDTLPPLPQTCHKQDHATTTIHEMTHARAVFEQEASTQDYAYGYENSTALTPIECLYNADSYSLYANAVYLNC